MIDDPSNQNPTKAPKSPMESGNVLTTEESSNEIRKQLKLAVFLIELLYRKRSISDFRLLIASETAASDLHLVKLS